MQAIFSLDDDPGAMKPVIDARAEEEQLDEKDRGYLDDIVEVVKENQANIDRYIGSFSIDWDISRLGKVERAILRIAIGEMMKMSDIPVSVSINEAVILSKKFGADQSSKFINGILGKFSREVIGEDRDR